jgi:hypothetical protein
VDVTPSARRLTESLRHIGYDFTTAVADIVDNSVAAGAHKIDITIHYDGASSYVLIADDGSGMTERGLYEALRFGTRRAYANGDLGRFGLGLKTASISQCRRLTVITRHSPVYTRLSARSLDLDHVFATDRWEIIEPSPSPALERAERWLYDGPGTVVVWEDLDRVLPEQRPESGWARRRIENLARKTSEYLSMVFHRFLEGEAGPSTITVAVNGMKLPAWNPLAPDEEERLALPVKRFELAVGNRIGEVWLHPFVLPPRSRFSSPTEFERLSGPLKWNRQQGLYVYRAGRLLQSGGWCGVRAADEHTKLARAALDFQTELDPLFQVNVAKMRVTLPPEIRTLIETPIQDLCHRAEAVYRKEPPPSAEAKQDRDLGHAHDISTPDPTAPKGNASGHGRAEGAGLVLRAAAMEVGEYEALGRIMGKVREREPDLATTLGW